MLPVMETFISLQGEGYHVGTPSYFIRVGGCDVGCYWCDVKESWDAGKHPLVSVDGIIDGIPEGVKTAVITGGEPLEFNMDYLTKRLKDRGIATHLETSGTDEFTGTWDWICLSPKKFKVPLPGIYSEAGELKVIIRTVHDFAFAEEQALKVHDSCVLYLQPEWSVQAEMTPRIIDYVEKNPHWKLSVQLHKFLKIP